MITNAKIEVLNLTNATLNQYNRYTESEIVITESPAFVEKKQGTTQGAAYSQQPSYEKPEWLQYDVSITIYRKIPKPTKVYIRLIEFNREVLETPEYFDVISWEEFPMIIQGGEIKGKYIKPPIFS